MFTKVLVANRGEIACRIIRTLDRLGIQSVAVYSDADAHARHVHMAGEAVCVGPAPAAESYLQVEKILAVAKETGAQAIHPGYGFLSENADFSAACEEAGIAFIGPTAQNMRDFGLKHTARAIALANDVPVSPGSSLLESLEEAYAAAETIGYPVMIKSTAGGGGIGMQMAANDSELAEKFGNVQRMSSSNFKTAGLFLEKFIASARHVEVQIFGDGHGTIAVLGERDCSTQRRNQKVIEETPAPCLPDEIRTRLHQAGRRLGEAAKYRSAGTCEFMYDAETGAFYFLEVNTRLQVEHCVTEEVSGLDLVEWMIRLAAGETLPLAAYRHAPKGHAIEARIYAEDPNKNFQPSCGILTEVQFPEEIRVDSWVERGSEITPFYDPMIAKIIAHGSTRDEAIEKLHSALGLTSLHGIETNLEYIRAILANDDFQRGGVTTRYLSSFFFQPKTIDVLEPGTQTTIQDWPGRIGYWEIGVPPSGPMDDLAFRLANRCVGNPEGTAALECTVTGPTLLFHRDSTLCVAGADMQPEVDGLRMPMEQAFEVRGGQVLKLHPVLGGGCRAYIAIRGGFDVPDYLGSKSTFTLGQFGGHGGRVLRSGDVLKFDNVQEISNGYHEEHHPQLHYKNEWDIGVIYGPHGAPDFFTPEDITLFFATDWLVHYNSSRTGVRLIGPKPQWARKDGGEAGLHPSNIHDNAYAIGAIDFTGDMPVILGPDGPSLGGFVCPAVIVSSELWKMGQLRPGDRVRFIRQAISPCHSTDSAILAEIPAKEGRPAVVYRPAGDSHLLIEYGPLVLDLALRMRVHALMTWLQEQKLSGLIDLTPGVRSLQVHFDPEIWSFDTLLSLLESVEKQLPDMEHLEVPSRIVRLPLSWDDPATRLAIEKYTQSVRKDAPWCPSNIEFIRRINGLESIEQVRDIVYSASYLVLGLGDVYLGAPVATPVDPRHRLVTTKYNPARTWTPENAVGIGGAYLCVYGMEGPGGYQFVGRTIQMWNRWRKTSEFLKPWLLRHFDQIQFYPVSPEELLLARTNFPHGHYPIEISATTFRLSDYRAFLAEISEESTAFKTRQQAAFEEERERWAASSISFEEEQEDTPMADESLLSEGSTSIESHITANVWKCEVEAGQSVVEGQVLIILEAMKMEIGVTAPRNGIVNTLSCKPGQMVIPGQRLAVID